MAIIRQCKHARLGKFGSTKTLPKTQKWLANRYWAEPKGNDKRPNKTFKKKSNAIKYYKSLK